MDIYTEGPSLKSPALLHINRMARDAVCEISRMVDKAHQEMRRYIPVQQRPAAAPCYWVHYYDWCEDTDSFVAGPYFTADETLAKADSIDYTPCLRVIHIEYEEGL